MKIFVIKTLIIFISFFVLFQLTIGSLVNSLKEDLSDQLSREKIIHVKDKIRDEMKKGIEKEQMLNPDDADLIGKFLKKLIKEVNIN
mgnify:FL=1|tara:strand:+ start:298 stop:558 length:261 start_codon:yes stop_codon:yes gene_type:complete